MTRDQEHRRTQSDSERSREYRVSLLKDLVDHRAYDVPAEDVAACIIRGVLVPGLAVPGRRQ